MDRPLFKNTTFYETSAMTFDEKEEKLYWAEGGDTIFSSTVDGTDIVEHVAIPGAHINCLVSKETAQAAISNFLKNERN